MSKNPYLGLNTNSRSPGSIVNAEFHDQTGSQKNLHGHPGAIDFVIATSTTATPLKDFGIVRVCNTDTAVQYIWFGKEDAVPGTINFASSIALPAGYCEVFFAGASDDAMKSIVVKTSSAAVQVVVIKS